VIISGLSTGVNDMARNMSFFYTQEQIRNKTKTVTRRLGWNFLKPGDILNACVKCQGLKKGEKIEKICQIRVRQIYRQWLWQITNDDVIKEGFPDMTTYQFVKMYRERMGLSCGHATVNRIEFDYI